MRRQRTGPEIISRPTSTATVIDGELTITPIAEASESSQVSDSGRRASGDSGSGEGASSAGEGSGSSTPNLPRSADGNDTLARLDAAAAKIAASETDSSSAGSVLQALMRRFVDLRRSGGRPRAWQQWMEDAALNAHLLSPVVIPYDNLMKLIMEVDTSILKGASEHVGRSPEQNLREFLSSGTIGGKPLDNVDHSMPQSAQIAKEDQ